MHKHQPFITFCGVGLATVLGVILGGMYWLKPLSWPMVGLSIVAVGLLSVVVMWLQRSEQAENWTPFDSWLRDFSLLLVPWSIGLTIITAISTATYLVSRSLANAVNKTQEAMNWALVLNTLSCIGLVVLAFIVFSVVFVMTEPDLDLMLDSDDEY